VSHQFCWDYESPTLGLGRFSTYYEIDIAKRHWLDYLYLGASYEDTAIYKSSFSGFEFWTGRIWSDDIEIYKSIVKKDSELSDICQITNYYQDYFDSLSV
jgi:arginyl-tRNA--protein-N-Asp/Glu arginylyltransferase